MSEPECVADFLATAVKCGWTRESLSKAPIWALTDWCRDRGWDGLAEYMETEDGSGALSLGLQPARFDRVMIWGRAAV
jgi:hypothetical protein